MDRINNYYSVGVEQGNNLQVILYKQFACPFDQHMPSLKNNWSQITITCCYDLS